MDLKRCYETVVTDVIVATHLVTGAGRHFNSFTLRVIKSTTGNICDTQKTDSDVLKRPKSKKRK
jgi:hypothetical protein